MMNYHHGGVFYLHAQSIAKGASKKHLAASRDLILSIVISLAIIAGFSTLLHAIDTRVNGGYFSNIQRHFFSEMRYLTGISVAEAATLDKTATPFDRTAYYEKNAKLFTQPKVIAKRRVVKKSTPTVKKTTKKTIKAVAKPVAFTTSKSIVTTAKASSPVAVKLIQSAQGLTLGQFERMAFEVGYKNTGSVTWGTPQDLPLTIHSSAKKESYFYDASWNSKNIATSLTTTAKPGEIAYFKFILAAPERVGLYQESLSLYRGAEKIEGTDFMLPIQVIQAVSPAPVLARTIPGTAVLAKNESRNTQPAVKEAIVATAQVAPAVQGSSTTPVPLSGVINDITTNESLIRVGVLSTKEPIQITANKDYEVRDAAKLLVSEKAGAITTVVFDAATKIYTITSNSGITTTNSPVRFTTIQSNPDADIIFEIPSYTNHPAWSNAYNDNTFRTALEIRYSSKTDKLWIINELMLENYLKGLAETSNGSPVEYQKALIIAARTYAQYHLNTNTKYASEGFTVRNTDADQVYRGYGSEKRMPNLANAVADTRGVMVTYDKQLAITPYYSQSDGRTRSWTEVWGGSAKPWLVAVDDPGSNGLAMWGHGVGMSARGALVMASEGNNFEQILKHYYTGIELRKTYQ